MNGLDYYIKSEKAAGKWVSVSAPDEPPIMCQCERCNDTGNIVVYSGHHAPLSSPPKRGSYIVHDGKFYEAKLKVFACPVCNPAGVEREGLQLLRRSGLVESEYGYSLKFFDDYPDRALPVRVATTILESAKFGGFAFFYGSYGVGKSGILKSVVAQFCRKGIRAQYKRLGDIVTESRGDSAIIDHYANMPVLAIDELDKGLPTDYASSIAMSLLDERYRRRDGLVTLLAANSDMATSSGEYDYLLDRFKDGLSVLVAGESLRG